MIPFQISHADTEYNTVPIDFLYLKCECETGLNGVLQSKRIFLFCVCMLGCLSVQWVLSRTVA